MRDAIKITYDPRRISYDQLLDVFFDAHVPTELNRQGEDVGTQYRSAIFYTDDEQKQAAEAKIQKLTKSKKYARPIVTKLERFKEFYPAEAYHQDYARKHPYDPYIQTHAIPKAHKVSKLHPDLANPSLATGATALKRDFDQGHVMLMLRDSQTWSRHERANSAYKKSPQGRNSSRGVSS